MQDLVKVKRCLISVSDKTGIVELAKFLEKQNIEIISTGGTRKLLANNNIKVKDISDLTKFPEMMDGRVKTLHPKVHGGLLGVLDNDEHVKAADEYDIGAIDLLIVNLYPFVETVAKSDDENLIIENIDIGGPAMVRSAAKNFAFKIVVTDVRQYQDLEQQLANDCHSNFEFRKNLAIQAFQNIANYDLAISNWFLQDKSFTLNGTLKQQLRYGENSHQKASLYQTSNSGIVGAKQIQGKELSYNNINDADAAYNLALEFEQPVAAIIKHASPCGVALAQNHLEAFKRAFQADSKSAFGGIVAINGVLDKKLAEEISKIFFEVIIVKEIDDEAREIMSKKKNLRVLIADFKHETQKQIKSVSGGFLVQDLDQKNITNLDLELVSQKKANEQEIEQLVFAMNLCKYVKSNAIVVVNDYQSVGLGGGQTSRVDACEIACKKASQFFDGNEVLDKARGGILASDAFFPFADNIEIAAKYGIKAIVATGGSVRDEEVINKANELGIILYFIKTRHFRH